MKKTDFPGTPFATTMARPGNETEQRIRHIVRFPKIKRPPPLLLVLAVMAALMCGNLAACQSGETPPEPSNSGQPLDGPGTVSSGNTSVNAPERSDGAVASVSLSVDGGRTVTVKLYGASVRPDDPDWAEYYAVEELRVYEDGALLQTIRADELSYDGDYLFDGLFYNPKGGEVGQPDHRDINFDGSEDLGLLAAESYPYNIPYCYLLWDESAGRLSTQPLLLFAPVTLNGENGEIVEYEKDGPFGYINNYRFNSDGELERLRSEPVQSVQPSARESYRDILLGNGDFINSNEDGTYQERVNIGDIKKVFTSSENVAGEVTKFAVVDMDGDGENEIVLCISTGSIEEGFEVLHYQDGEVYGYHFWYRALNCLAEDGTFIASGGASDSSINKITFLEEGYAVDTLSYQTQKAGVEWYALTSENVELAFENRF